MASGLGASEGGGLGVSCLSGGRARVGGGPPMALGWHGGGGIGSRGLTGGRVGSSVGGCLERSGGGWGMLVTAVWVVLMGSLTVLWFVWREILPRLGRGAAGDLGRGLVSSRGKGWVCGWGS